VHEQLLSSAIVTARFALRAPTEADAAAIARAHTESWQTSYRGILPDSILDRIDVGQRADSRRRVLRDRSVFQLVAYDTTHGDIVGFCDAGRSRRGAAQAGEVYAIYIVDRAKRHGLGVEMFARVRAYLAANAMSSMIVWVLDHNVHARRFYEAIGGRLGPQLRTTVGGFGVVEQAYVWDRV
jgi:GNAT superfamily N-acetyltransferase